MESTEPNSPGKRAVLSLLGLFAPACIAAALGAVGAMMMVAAIDGSGQNVPNVEGHAVEIYLGALIGIASSGLLFGFAFVGPHPIRWMIQSGVVIASVSVLVSAGAILYYLYVSLSGTG